MISSYVVMMRVEVDEKDHDDPKRWSWDLILDEPGIKVLDVTSLRVGDV